MTPPLRGKSETFSRSDWPVGMTVVGIVLIVTSYKKAQPAVGGNISLVGGPVLYKKVLAWETVSKRYSSMDSVKFPP